MQQGKQELEFLALSLAITIYFTSFKKINTFHILEICNYLY